jgi:hypothetical protein
MAQGIDHEPAFNWWVPHVLKKCDRIIPLVCKRTTRYLKQTHKFGIEVPKTVKEALALDRKKWQHPLGGCHCKGDEGGLHCLQHSI